MPVHPRITINAHQGLLGHRRPRILYTYPTSPGSSGRSSPEPSTPVQPISQRLRRLKAELAALEAEAGDPANPALANDGEAHVEPGDLIRDIVDAKSRLDKIAKLKEGRGKIVNVVLQSGEAPKQESVAEAEQDKGDAPVEEDAEKPPAVRDVSEMDKRIGELEKIIGSSNTALDEVRIQHSVSLNKPLT